MIRTVGACAATAAVVLAVTSGGVLAGQRTARATPFVPACPQASYGADGNMSPLFCVIDNPVALRYFHKMGAHTFALGRNATPSQVSAALVFDYKHGGTEPILCSIYQLTAWREHWSFGVSPAANAGVTLRFPNHWCSDPHFPNVG